MDPNKFSKEQAREFLKKEALKEVNNVSDFTRFQTRVFCVIAKYGMQLEAKKEGLLTGDEWIDPDCVGLLVKKIELFFDTHIK